MKKIKKTLYAVLIAGMALLTACGNTETTVPAETETTAEEVHIVYGTPVDLDEMVFVDDEPHDVEPEEPSPEDMDVYPDDDVRPNPSLVSDTAYLCSMASYTGNAYVEVNGNVPYFTEFTTDSFESYGELDSLGRCTTAYACLGQDLMPTESRGDISSVKPTGWVQEAYDFVDGGYLYNRCHLIAFELAGENANPKNLITGTRYFNVTGMLPFENMTTDYIKETGNHVMYRVTPVFDGNNLVADGVLMEGWSVEDEGDGICFCVFVYDVQPGVIIDYATGESRMDTESEYGLAVIEENPEKYEDQDYVLNTNTMKFHYPSCSSATSMNEKNRQDYHGNREDLISQGYSPCGFCKP